jgi:DNA repair protein RadA/Sms
VKRLFSKQKTKTGQKVSIKPAESFSVKTALSSQTGYTFSTGIGEFDRVLGPGLTKGGVYLLAGQPGIGKSTLLTQLALKSQISVVYVCSEENPAQVASRIKRLSSKENSHIKLLNTSTVENVLELSNQTQLPCHHRLHPVSQYSHQSYHSRLPLPDQG